jgi:hypothetical protein
MYSGPVAAHAFHELAKDGVPEVLVILGPNHHGVGAPVAVALEDFATPLGVAKVEQELGRKVLAGIIESDMEAHRYEHSIEVQVPFLQHLRQDVKIVPISMAMQDYETARQVGETVREAIQGRDVVVVASTDFSHYVPRAVAERKDSLALREIGRMDPEGLYRTVIRNNITMCGYGPVVAALTAVRAKEARLLKYGTSGDMVPMRDVVGYAAVRVGD